jgi:ribosomal protein S4E
MSGTYAPKASPGPHKLRDCLPLIVFIRNRYDSLDLETTTPTELRN